MLKNYNKYKILKIFLYNPTESFRLRELSRLSGISPLSVSNYLKELEKESLLKRTLKRGIPFYQAVRDNDRFISYQRLSIIYEIEESGVIESIWDSVCPEAIILYGSYAKGEATEGSDIDLCIISKEKDIDLKKFEDIIGKKIHLMFFQDFRRVSKELRNNLINGIIIKGYVKAF